MTLKPLVCVGLMALSAAMTVQSQVIECTNPPVVSVTPLNQFVLQGDTATFTANVAGGVGPFNMYWWANGELLTPLTGANNNITLNNVTTADAGLYFVVWYDLSTGCGGISAGKLFVAPNLNRGQAKKLLRQSE